MKRTVHVICALLLLFAACGKSGQNSEEDFPKTEPSPQVAVSCAEEVCQRSGKPQDGLTISSGSESLAENTNTIIDPSTQESGSSAQESASHFEEFQENLVVSSDAPTSKATAVEKITVDGTTFSSTITEYDTGLGTRIVNINYRDIYAPLWEFLYKVPNLTKFVIEDYSHTPAEDLDLSNCYRRAQMGSSANQGKKYL